MYADSLLQTPTYQKIFREGYEEGWREGFQEGWLNGLRKSVLIVVEKRFPSLIELARDRVSKVSNTDVLHYAFKVLLMAPEEETARILINLLPA